MTTPPSDQNPDERDDPAGRSGATGGNVPAGAEDYPPDYVAPGYPPPGYRQPYQQPYQQPYGAPPPPRPQGKIAIGTAIVGAFGYFVVNFIIGFGAFMVAGGEDKVVFGGTALMLALIAFGGGALLLTRTSRDAKGLGLGLMIGWAITSVVTAGFCTGINPSMYTT